MTARREWLVILHQVSLILAIALMASAAPLSAQTYPAKSIRFLVGFPPGGGSDIMARSVSQRLSESLSRQVVVDNRPGANANIAAETAARSPPDGYTMVLISAPHAVSKTLYRSLAYDLEKDLTPIALLGTVPHALIVHPSLPAKSVNELISLARARSGQLTVASAGVGATDHIAAEMFASMAKVKYLHVPYKGSGPALVDLVSGQVAAMFASMPSAVPYVRNGRVRSLAVTGAKRAVVMPEIPTIAESGLPGYELTTWYGIMFPAGTPREIVARMNTEINRAISLPDVRERLAAVGAEPLGGTPEAYGAVIKSDVARFTKIIKDADIQAE
jgi:tripartite-type tricarboxylate transporter receptor subunit TctC